MMKFIRKIIPPARWKVPVIFLLGIFTGLLIYVLYISKAHSYLSDRPTACVNCHIMAPQYATWFHSAHREVTHCNECHVPHDNFFKHYYFKAKDGLRHATIFTLRNEPQVIEIKKAGQEVVQQNCIRCHEQLIKNPEMLTQRTYHSINARTKRKCWECHREVPHGRENSLSLTPYARVPVPESPVPDWMKEVMEE
ncbi:MAG: cytochrome c nitrite reductase small subunit [Bacteroidales bacterium]|nr:cytochrome c nitrite reductase small subunit [Bacteroidales bacterium]